MEYRANYFTDVIVQPVASTLIELTLWCAVFASTGGASVGGFGREYYLSYAIWAAFVSRVTSNWMYEFKMIAEVESGTVNTILVRPTSFYEYYLSQFLGYKLSTLFFSVLVPVLAVKLWGLPSELSRLPAVLALVFCYLILLHTLSFAIACLAFQLNRVGSLTVAKNLCLWVLSGELFPLDLLPEPLKSTVISLPFSSAVYLPVGYLTGRIGSDVFAHGFISVGCGILVVGVAARIVWGWGIVRYTGTGA